MSQQSTVSYMDCAIRLNKCSDHYVHSSDVPGFCAVGHIVALSSSVSDDSFKIGDRIATILVKGGNARYAIQNLSRIVKVSQTDSARQVCGLLSSYFSAFACLQQNIEAPRRHQRDSLNGKSILVHGAMSVVGQATIHLANYLGAQTVLATGKPGDFKHLKKIGASPIHLGALAEPSSELERAIDTIVDCTTYDSIEHLLKISKTNGNIIIYKHGDISKNGRHSMRTDFSTLLLKLKVIMHEKISICDPIQDIFIDNFDLFKVSAIKSFINWLHNSQLIVIYFVKLDFDFLLSLMKKSNKVESLKPRIVSTVSLDDVPYTHVKLETKNVKGVITVDPWE